MEGIKKGILRGFLELDEKLRKIPEVASGEDKSGSTAVGALISGWYAGPYCRWRVVHCIEYIEDNNDFHLGFNYSSETMVFY